MGPTGPILVSGPLRALNLHCRTGRTLVTRAALRRLPPGSPRFVMTDLAIAIRPELPADGDAIDRLHERAFGPGRFARSAYLLRERAPALPELSFVACVGSLLVGSVRVSPVDAGGVPALVLGPLAVEPAFEKRGIGAALMERTLEEARRAGHTLVILVGDEPYYARFGFHRIPPGRLTLPGPVDPARFLAAELVPGALDGAAGRVTAPR
jgi:predicted N-acetyltransferase YhbS